MEVVGSQESKGPEKDADKRERKEAKKIKKEMKKLKKEANFAWPGCAMCGTMYVVCM